MDLGLPPVSTKGAARARLSEVVPAINSFRDKQWPDFRLVEVYKTAIKSKGTAQESAAPRSGADGGGP